MHMLYKRLTGICFLFIPNIIIILFQFIITFVRQLLLFTNIMLDINRIKIRFLPSKPSRFPILAGCTRRHDSHVDGQKPKHFSPLGTSIHFLVNSSKKIKLYSPPWPPCTVVGNQEYTSTST